MDGSRAIRKPPPLIMLGATLFAPGARWRRRRITRIEAISQISGSMGANAFVRAKPDTWSIDQCPLRPSKKVMAS